MLARNIWTPRASSSSWVIPLTVPAVPTGMNTGVSTTPCGVWRRPARARVFSSRATISNFGPIAEEKPRGKRGEVAKGRLRVVSARGRPTPASLPPRPPNVEALRSVHPHTNSGNKGQRTLTATQPPGIPTGDVYLKLTVIDDVLVVSFKEL